MYICVYIYIYIYLFIIISAARGRRRAHRGARGLRSPRALTIILRGTRATTPGFHKQDFRLEYFRQGLNIIIIIIRLHYQIITLV